MQTSSWNRTCHQSIQFPRLRAGAIVIPFKVRNLAIRTATREHPGFGSAPPPPKGRKVDKAGSPDFSAGQSASKGHKSSKGNPTEKTGGAWPRRKFPVGKFIIFSFLGYIGHRVYSWQTNPYRSRILDPKNFTPFILKHKETVSSTSSILQLLSLPKGQNVSNIAEVWKTGVWSVQVMQPELQIARSYTPLPPADDAEPEELRLFVRIEPQGEVSSMLHKISRGTLVHLRGPQLEYEVPQGVDEVLFLAGGTGIAPALQVAHILYKYRATSSGLAPKLRIIWANRRREDSFMGASSPQHTSHSPSQNALVKEVESLKTKYNGNVNIEYFIDDQSTFITESLLRNYIEDIKPLSEQAIQDHRSGKRLILISGPEGFVNNYAGPKTMRGGRELQGPLGGLLQKIDPQGWEIWKL